MNVQDEDTIEDLLSKINIQRQRPFSQKGISSAIEKLHANEVHVVGDLQNHTLADLKSEVGIISIATAIYNFLQHRRQRLTNNNRNEDDHGYCDEGDCGATFGHVESPLPPREIIDHLPRFDIPESPLSFVPATNNSSSKSNLDEKLLYGARAKTDPLIKGTTSEKNNNEETQPNSGDGNPIIINDDSDGSENDSPNVENMSLSCEEPSDTYTEEEEERPCGMVLYLTHKHKKFVPINGAQQYTNMIEDDEDDGFAKNSPPGKDCGTDDDSSSEESIYLADLAASSAESVDLDDTPEGSIDLDVSSEGSSGLDGISEESIDLDEDGLNESPQELSRYMQEKLEDEKIAQDRAQRPDRIELPPPGPNLNSNDEQQASGTNVANTGAVLQGSIPEDESALQKLREMIQSLITAFKEDWKKKRQSQEGRKEDKKLAWLLSHPSLKEELQKELAHLEQRLDKLVEEVIRSFGISVKASTIEDALIPTLDYICLTEHKIHLYNCPEVVLSPTQPSEQVKVQATGASIDDPISLDDDDESNDSAQTGRHTESAGGRGSDSANTNSASNDASAKKRRTSSGYDDDDDDDWLDNDLIDNESDHGDQYYPAAGNELSEPHNEEPCSESPYRKLKGKGKLHSDNADYSVSGNGNGGATSTSKDDVADVLKKFDEKTREEISNEIKRRERFEQLRKEHEHRVRLSQSSAAQEVSEIERTVNIGCKENEKRITFRPHIFNLLKEHQRRGVQFLWQNIVQSEEHERGCIIAHSMGLGKTTQAVVFVELFCQENSGARVLIIAPKSILESTWEMEFAKWSSISCETIHTLSAEMSPSTRFANIETWHKGGGILITNEDMFLSLTGYSNKGRKAKNNTKMDTQAARNLFADTNLLIYDEAHLLSGEDIIITQALNEVIKTRNRIMLSGTPLQNDLLEYWRLIEFVRPGLLGTKDYFESVFVKPIMQETDYKWANQVVHVLNEQLSQVVCRQSESHLKKELTVNKHEFVLFINNTKVQSHISKMYMDSKTVGKGIFRVQMRYNRLTTHPDVLREYLEKQTRHASIAPTTSSESASEDDAEEGDNPSTKETYHPKDPDVLRYFMSSEYQKGTLENSAKMTFLAHLIDKVVATEKILVFSQWKFSLDSIETFLKCLPSSTETLQRDVSLLRLDGDTPDGQRRDIVERFEKDEKVRILLMTITAGGVGLTLTAASRVVHFDLHYNPAKVSQATARVYRFGQKRDIFIYYLFSPGQLKVFEALLSKRKLCRMVVDQKAVMINYKDGDKGDPSDKFDRKVNIDAKCLEADPILKQVYDQVQPMVHSLFNDQEMFNEDNELSPEEKNEGTAKFHESSKRYNDKDHKPHRSNRTRKDHQNRPVTPRLSSSTASSSSSPQLTIPPSLQTPSTPTSASTVITAEVPPSAPAAAATTPAQPHTRDSPSCLPLTKTTQLTEAANIGQAPPTNNVDGACTGASDQGALSTGTKEAAEAAPTVATTVAPKPKTNSARKPAPQPTNNNNNNNNNNRKRTSSEAPDSSSTTSTSGSSSPLYACSICVKVCPKEPHQYRMPLSSLLCSKCNAKQATQQTPSQPTPKQQQQQQQEQSPPSAPSASKRPRTELPPPSQPQ